jgi:hypothetical protein
MDNQLVLNISMPLEGVPSLTIIVGNITINLNLNITRTHGISQVDLVNIGEQIDQDIYEAETTRQLELSRTDDLDDIEYLLALSNE